MPTSPSQAFIKGRAYVMLFFFDRPEGRWLVRRLGTRSEARPAGWSLHRTGMRPDMRVSFLVFSYTEEPTPEETLLHARIPVGSSSAFLQTRRTKNMLSLGGVAGRARCNARHRPNQAPKRLPPAGPPEAHAEFFCHRRKRRIKV
jgi:hypothetical protein